MDRRKFIGTAAAGSAAALLMPELLKAGDLFKAKHPIGFQTYPIRDMVTKDFSGTMKTMAGMGYQYTEMCYPKGYDDFKPLASIAPADLKKMIEDAGLTCPSCHFGMGDLKNNFKDCMDFAHGLGMTQIVTPGLDTPGKTIDDYKQACGDLNKIAAQVKAEGLATGLHNHEGEFKKIDGVLIYDAILEALDPKLVKMQFQTEVVKLGYNAADYFRIYPGRFISAHLSDWTADKKQVPIGQGVIDWKEFFDTANKTGVKNFFVEMNFDTYKDSATYIHGLLG
ncbi:MAG TPA: TIM barrel protein [Mucilaginibacter sp.]|jgi:sugar phosphate isomerase/epimerase|nr:TIM barrel protein [Mucilaginibacter sp.]